MWRGRLGTATAMAVLCFARLVVAVVPFHRWRNSLGAPAGDRNAEPSPDCAFPQARRSAAHVERAATRLPFATKCLPRAVALSWILRHKRIGHTMVFAVRPAHQRDEPDALHCWVEIEGTKILGDLPGPWVETLRLGG